MRMWPPPCSASIGAAAADSMSAARSAARVAPGSVGAGLVVVVMSVGVGRPMISLGRASQLEPRPNRWRLGGSSCTRKSSRPARGDMTSMNSETASTLRSTTGAGSTRADDETPVTPAQPVHPYVHVVVVAVIGAVVVLAWLWVYHTLNALIWENSVVTANRWLFPVIC